jgi:lysophospholipase L1-like esterase
LALNVLILVGGASYVIHKGGTGFLLRRAGLEKTTFKPLPFQKEMEEFQAVLPIHPADTVFVGDSITADAPYAEYFTTIKKRGVGGETTIAILGRLDGILQNKPAKLFLMAGTNDLCQDIRVSEIVDNYKTILGHIAQISPKSVVYVIGVPPCNARIRNAPFDPSPEIPELNRQLEAICKERNLVFIEDGPALSDSQGQLKPEYTKDGLHFNAAGYAQLMKLIAPYGPGLPSSN